MAGSVKTAWAFGLRRFFLLWYCVFYLKSAPHPSPLPRERGPIRGLSNPEFDSVVQVGVACKNNPISSLSLRERARRAAFR